MRVSLARATMISPHDNLPARRRPATVSMNHYDTDRIGATSS